MDNTNPTLKRKAAPEVPAGWEPKRFNLLNQNAFQPSTSNGMIPLPAFVPPPIPLATFPKKEATVSIFGQPLVPAIPPGPSASSTSKLMKYSCQNPYYSIIIIPNGHPHLFFGWCGVICYSGSIWIDGYELEASSFDGDPESMTSVCAPACDGRPAFFESRTPNPEKASLKEKRLRLRLKEVTPEYDRIVDEWRDEGVSILLIYRKAPIAVELFTQIHEDALYFSQQDVYGDRMDMVESSSWQIYRKESWHALDAALDHLKRRNGSGLKSTVLPYGCKGSGKSTFLRILINRLLSMKLTVFMIDADLGQTEYTPAGCMSLWKVTKPLLEVAWCHQATEYEHSYFYSDVHPADNMSKYKNISVRLLNAFNEKSEPDAVLVINTMGWVEGAGRDALQHIVNCSGPSCIFELSGRERLVPLSLPAECQRYQITKDYPLKTNGNKFKNYHPHSLKAAEYRDLRTISYFSHVMTKPFFANVLEGRKFKINFHDAKIGVPEDLAAVDDRYFLATLNVQLVALCSTEEHVAGRRILQRDYLPQLFMIDAATPLLRCYGFGIISAVDLDKKQFVIISPISPKEMQKVTVIARGRNIKVPSPMCRTSNGKPAMYHMTSLDNMGDVDPDLFSSLRTEHQERFRRQYFPAQT